MIGHHGAFSGSTRRVNAELGPFEHNWARSEISNGIALPIAVKRFPSLVQGMQSLVSNNPQNAFILWFIEAIRRISRQLRDPFTGRKVLLFLNVFWRTLLRM